MSETYGISIEMTVGSGAATSLGNIKSTFEELIALKNRLEKPIELGVEKGNLDSIKSEIQQLLELQKKAGTGSGAIFGTGTPESKEALDYYREVSKLQETAAESKREYYDNANNFKAQETERQNINDLSRAISTQSQLWTELGTGVGKVSDTILSATTAMASNFSKVQDELQSVRRTTLEIGADSSKMNSQLLGVSNEIVGGMSSVSNIAEIGGAAGVTAEKIEDYTRSIAMYADSTEVTADKAALSIAKIYNVTKAQNPDLTFDSLSNALFTVGNEAASTSDEILAITTRLAPLASQFKINADEIIGMGSSLASFGISAERGSTSMIRGFSAISKIVGEGGEQLNLLSSIAGTTAKQFASDWETSPVQAFKAVLSGMQKAQYGGNQFITTMTNLGLNATRDAQSWMALSNNMGEFDRQLGIANDSLYGGTELQDRYAERLKTVSQQLELVKQNFESLSYTALEGIPLQPLEALVSLLQTVNKFMQEHPGHAMFTGMLGAVLLLTGALGKAFASLMTVRGAIAQYQMAQLAAAQAGANFSTSLKAMTLNGVGFNQGLVNNIRALFGFNKEVQMTVKGMGEVTGATSTATTAIETQTAALGQKTAAGAATSKSMQSFAVAESGVAAGAKTSTAALSGQTAALGTVGTAAKGASGGVSAFSGTVKGLGKALGGLLALGAVTELFDRAMRLGESSQKTSRERYEEAGNSATDFSQAIEDGRASLNKYVSDARFSEAAFSGIGSGAVSAAGGVDTLNSAIAKMHGPEAAEAFKDALSNIKIDATMDKELDRNLRLIPFLGDIFADQVPRVQGSVKEIEDSLNSLKGEVIGVTEISKAEIDIGLGNGPAQGPYLANIVETAKKQYEEIKFSGVSAFEQVNKAMERSGGDAGAMKRDLESTANAFDRLNSMNDTHQWGQAAAQNIADRAKIVEQLSKATGMTKEEINALDDNKIAKLSELFHAGALTAEEFTEATKKSKTAVEELGEKYESALEGQNNIVAAEKALNSFAEELRTTDKELSVTGNAAQDMASMIGYLEASAKSGDPFSGLATSLYALRDAGINSGEMFEYVKGRMEELLYFGNLIGDNSVKLDVDTSLAQGNIQAAIDKIKEYLSYLVKAGHDAYKDFRAAADNGDSWSPDKHAEYKATYDKAVSAQKALAEMDKYGTSVKKAKTSADNASTNAINKNTGATKNNTAAQKENRRSILDWIKDIESVTKSMNDMAFGLIDAQYEYAVAWEESTIAMEKHKIGLREIEDLTGDVITKLFGRQKGQDEIADAWESIKDKIADAKDEYKELQAELAEQKATENQLKYWLEVARAVGDVAREQEILAQLEKNKAQQSKTKKDASESKQTMDFTITGDTKGAREMRGEVFGLLDLYMKQAVVIAQTAKSEKEYNKQMTALKGQFKNQMLALGATSAEVDYASKAFDSYKLVIFKTATEEKNAWEAAKKLATATQNLVTQQKLHGVSQKTINKTIKIANERLDKMKKNLGLTTTETKKVKSAVSDMNKILAKIPKNINIKLNVDKKPAESAIAVFLKSLDSKANKSAASSAGGALGSAMGSAMKSSLKKVELTVSLPKMSKRDADTLLQKAKSSNSANAANVKALIASFKASGIWPYKKGGYTGDRSPDDIAGFVHGKEYVINAKATRENRPVLEAMNQGYTFSASSLQPQGGMSLSKESIYQLGSVILAGINSQNVNILSTSISQSQQKLARVKSAGAIR